MTPGSRTASLSIRDDSVLHFDLEAVGAPTIRQRVTMQVEVSNTLIGVGKALVIPMEFGWIP